MPLLSDASLMVVLKFLQILLWISIPAFLIAMLITTLVHYSKKRKQDQNGEEPMAEDENKRIEDGDRATPVLQLYENKPEVRGLRRRLSRSNARYIAVRKDFEALTERYRCFITNIDHDSETIKKEVMEATQTDMQQTANEQFDHIKQQYELEKKELRSELNQLNLAFENLEKDNTSLRDQLSAFTHGTEAAMIQKLEDEKSELRKKIIEQEYLKDVLDEKKQQIIFLQQQSEQRIKNHHLVEQQFREIGIKYMEAREELETKRQVCKELQSAVHVKEQEIIFLKDIVQSNADSTTQMGTTLKELQEQNSNYRLAAEDKERIISDLQEQLTNSKSQTKELEERLERNQTFFKGFHRKLSDILEEQMPSSPVITMKPIYKGEGISEQISESVIQ